VETISVMKQRQIVFLLCLGVLTVQDSTIIASAENFTCQVYGGSFVLDDADFKAIENSGVTRQTFPAIKAEQRATICLTRKLWRLIKDGKASVCDFTAHYKGYDTQYFDDSEVDRVMDAQTNAAAPGLAGKLAGSTQKCQ
jgi:hypothetical protein